MPGPGWMARAALLCALCACPGPEPTTSVRLAVAYQERWGLEALEVSARDKAFRVPVASVLELRFPADWADTRVKVVVEGYRGQIVVATGWVEVTPRQGQQARATVVLQLVSEAQDGGAGDGGDDGGARTDGSAADGSLTDAALPDASDRDRPMADASRPDAGEADARPPDSWVVDAPGVDAAPRVDSGPGDLVGVDLACRPGTHRCGASCVDDHAVSSCGSRCEPCPEQDNAYAQCDGTACFYQCRPGFHDCGGACVANDDPAHCGLRCQPCPGDPYGAAICVDSACGLACGAGAVLRGDACQPWLLETVDTYLDSGRYCDLTLDAAGRPQVSYIHDLDDSYMDLYHAVRDGSWTLDNAFSLLQWTNEPTAIALDGSGQPVIAYADWDLNVSYAAGGDWAQARVYDAADGVDGPSLARGSGGQLWLSFHDGEHNTLMAAHGGGGAWTVETVDSDSDCWGETALAVDAAGNPAISYYNWVAGDLDELMFARRSSTGWATETVDGLFDRGWDVALAIDAQGRPHIAYGKQDEAVLGYAVRDVGSWRLERAAEGAVSRCALALDPGGAPHIAFADEAGLLWLASRGASGSWSRVQVTTEGALGDLAFEIDGQGRPHVVFYEMTNKDLKYATLE